MNRKPLLYLGYVVGLSWLSWITLPDARSKGFVPPCAEERSAAVGTTSGVPPILQAAFDPENGSFSPIPVPGQSDWLVGLKGGEGSNL